MGHSDKPLFFVGGILAALALIVGYNSLVLNHGHHDGQPKDGQALIEKEPAPVALATAAATDGAPAPAASGDIATLVAAANVGKGKKLFRRCASCHSSKKGDPPALGPNLYGVVGRPLASQAAFAGYSQALKDKGGTWTVEALSEFIASPKLYAPGTKMIFSGIKSEAKRADLLAYIKTLSD